MVTVSAVAAATANNPLLSDWSKTMRYGLPPFADVRPSHFKPAFDEAMKHHFAELSAIVACDDPTFDSVIAEFDRCGGLLSRTSMLFDNLCSSCAPPELQEVQLTIAPILAAHDNKIYTFPGLFERIAAVHANRAEACTSLEQQRLTERIYLDFVRAGAELGSDAQARYAEITERLSVLMTQFMQNVMADESQVSVEVSETDLAGCPSFLVAAARAAAAERGMAEGTHIITLSRSLAEPFLTSSPRRDLREKVWRLWTSRGELDGARDNSAIAMEILRLRAEAATLHGHETYAHYQTADTMAQTPAAVMGLLEQTWAPACKAALSERDEIRAFLAHELGEPDAQVEPWDWRYCAEQVRMTKYAFDENALKPYLSLPVMQRALFATVEKLYGLRFVRVLDGPPLYHPDVELYEVREPTGKDGEERLVALFLHDNYARPNKQSGAWMSEFRMQTRNWKTLRFGEGADVMVTSARASDEQLPIVINNNNFAKGAAGEPALLSFDDALTLFHEMGHGLHGMLSSVTYSRLSGTSVLRDFVELPSQLLEHWLSSTDVVLREHAIHYQTGEAVPAEMLAQLGRARKFNLGFETVEYTSCALVDQALHSLPQEAIDSLDLATFEREELERLHMPEGIVMRHRPPHFLHLFASSGYAAMYYVYQWAEVLDADAFDTFLETGDVFDQPTAARLRKWVYSSGNSVEPGEAYRQFKGRDATVEPMMRNKGLLEVAA